MIRISSTEKPLPAVKIENDHLLLEIIPEIGGRITRIYSKPADCEFLWQNPSSKHQRCQPGDSYDAHFCGGIDEIIPNDTSEYMGDTEYVDHGELWTLPLQSHIIDQALVLSGELRCGLRYERTIRLHATRPQIINEYVVQNTHQTPVSFIWKMHAALNICPGDIIECPASIARVADPAWSKWKAASSFKWPIIEGYAVNIIPPPENTTDYLYMLQLNQGHVALYSPMRKVRFSYEFDLSVFPCICYFASYGGFNNHYFAVLEPSTAPAASVKKAVQENSCWTLSAGQTLRTTMIIKADRADF